MPRLIGDRLSELRIARIKDIESVLSTLTYREREIFKLRTGLQDGFCYTVHEVGQIFRLSASRVSQIHIRARKKFLDRISHFLPETHLDPIVVRSVLQDTTSLTPFLIQHLRCSGADLRFLPWQVFEHLVAEFFASWGYDDVRLVGRSGKTAADIFAMRKVQPDGTELRVFVETKRWKDRVGVEVIDRVYGAFLGEKTTFGWHMAMVVTVSGFTNLAKYTPNQLRMMGISIKDGDDIRQWLANYRFNKSGLWLPEPKCLSDVERSDDE